MNGSDLTVYICTGFMKASYNPMMVVRGGIK